MSAKVRSASPGLPRNPSGKKKDANGEKKDNNVLHVHEHHENHDPHKHNGHHHGQHKHHDHHDHHDHHVGPILPPIEPCDSHIHVSNHDEIIIQETNIEVRKIEMETITKVRKEVKEEIETINGGVIELLTKGRKDERGLMIFAEGEHFMEEMFRKFESDFFQRWKMEFLYTCLQKWLEKQIVEYIERIVSERSEEIIKTFEKSIALIEEKHRIEIIEIERHHRNTLLLVVRKAWEEYEKRMQDIEFKKTITFKYRMSEEKEAWGEIIESLVPELLEHVPCVYKPDWCVDGM
jgi:hypothetical protein